MRPWSISGWKNWLNEPHVADRMTTGFQSFCFSSSAIAWVQNTPDVSISTTSAFEAASVVNWFVRFGSVGSWNCWSMTLRSEPSMALAKPFT